jgi:chromosomal replication initiator protein
LGSVAALSSQLAKRLGAKRFELWFGPPTQLSIDGTGLTLRGPSTFHCECLRKYFADEIRECWNAVLGGSGTVHFEVGDSLTRVDEAAENGEANRTRKSRETAGSKRQAPNGHAEAELPSARAELTLERFVVGPSNEYAFNAAELTGKGRQQACPVLFCGPTGVGKTHLLRAVQREYRRRHPQWTAVYLTAEQFTTSFVEAIRGSGLPSFRQKCRGARLLVIDDVQFFIGKTRTIEELQHTIDALLAEGRQLVLASDRSPAELRALGSEICSRLSGGLTCEIEPPEYGTRVNIVRRLAAEMLLPLDDALLSMIALQVTGGARELRGALYRIQAMSLADAGPVTSEMVQRALSDLARHSTRPVRLADVQKAVCVVFGVEPAQLRSQRKERALAEPRMLAMWLARKYTRAPWSEIGQYFGRRSHSTVISAHRRVEKLLGSQAKIGMNDQSCHVEDAIRKLENALRSA